MNTYGSRSNHSNSALKEMADGIFEHDYPEFSSSEQLDVYVSELLAWFAADNGKATPPSCLLDVVTTLSDRNFLSKAGLGAKLIDEFGSIGGVLSADTGRLFRWLEREGQADWFAQQVSLRLKATAALMEHSLAERIKDRPLISSWQALLDYLKFSIGHQSTEQFRLLFLDKKNFLIKDEPQQSGTVDHTPLYPREVAKRSLELGASAIIMVHNHPSGDPTPSRADIEITKLVETALAPIRICLHDHLIIGRQGHLSFRSEGLL